ncbi:phosphodiesterase [Denitrobaculum tricleocarpae]|uniref:Phosphodiesterase n=1 Tax=Denitrobaculum tricleocarpae TaxID=2591009 RepID=A0A545T5L0_9PROT|nr:phosphodiesterase [Denitrobaculum tricleocarpae]TQV72521.1 phosphodiesterase [Denitrobaculum tricleocarpae]
MIVAQITDTHIKPRGALAYGRLNTAPFLAAAVAHINTLDPLPDLVILTGDVTDGGAPEEFDHVRELLAPLTPPLIALPGNHDRRETFREAFRDRADMPEHGHLSYAEERFPLRLVMVDDTVPGQPHGEVTAELADWLEHTLAAASGKPTLVAMHHPPFITGIGHMDVQNCRGSERLAAVLEKHPQVLGLVCGHVHRNILTAFAGKPASVCPSQAHAVSLALTPDAPPSYHMEPPSLHLHRWHDDATPFGSLLTHQSFIGDIDGPHSFAMK